MVRRQIDLKLCLAYCGLLVLDVHIECLEVRQCGRAAQVLLLLCSELLLVRALHAMHALSSRLWFPFYDWSRLILLQLLHFFPGNRRYLPW